MRWPDARLLTLTGRDGVGKARLAQRATKAVIDAVAHGGAFVGLAPVRDPASVATTII